MRRLYLSFAALGLGLAVIAGCARVEPQQPSPAPAPTASSYSSEPDVPLRVRTIWTGSYRDDIQPTFDRYCVGCHGPNRAENGLRLDSYEGVMAGTRFGRIVYPGAAGMSTLMYVIDGTAAPQIQMPHQGHMLTPNRIANIRAWIDAGAPAE